MKVKSLIILCFFLIIIPFSNSIVVNNTFEENFPASTFEFFTDTIGEVNPFYNNLTGISKISMNNNWWFVDDSTTLGFRVHNATHPGSDNTQHSITFTAENISAVNVRANLLYEFPDNVLIMNYTNFSFYCSRMIEAQGDMFIVWGKENGSYYGMTLDNSNALGDSSCNIGANGFNGNVDCCDINDKSWFNQLCLTLNTTKINFTGTDLSSDCNNWDTFNDGTIKLFGFRGVQDQQGRAGIIDDVIIKDYRTGINEIPTVNFTFTQNYYCINQSTNVAEIEFNITANDPENDIIYYAFDIIGATSSKYINYYQEHCILETILGFFNSYSCSYDPDYSYQSNVIYLNDTCRICSGALCGGNILYHYDYIIQEGDILSIINHTAETVSGLALENSCSGNNKVYTYKLNKKYIDFAYSTPIYDLEDTENYSINFLDSNFNQIISINVIADSGNLILYTLNSSDIYELFFNQSVNYNVTTIHIITNDTNDKFTLNLHDNNGNDFIVNDINSHLLTGLLVPTFKYVQINFTNTENILQGGFYYSGLEDTFDWKSGISNKYFTKSIGLLPFIIFVTDTSHLGTNEYNSNIQYVNVYDSSNPVCILPYTQKVDTWDYINVNEFTGIPYYIDVVLWLLRLPSRLIKQFGLYTQVLTGSIIVLVIGFFIFLNRYRNMKDTSISLFISAIILYFLNVVYLDIFVIIAFFFSYFITQDFVPDITEDREIKHLFFSYLIFFIIMFLTGLSSVTNITTSTLNLLNVENILSFSGIFTIMSTMVNIFISFLLFVIIPIEQNYISLIFITIINIFIIMIKTVVIFQLLQYMKKLIEALPFF